ncbi:uncharacterized protein LOC134835599 isoform X2 [Culicoides brevitarsis]|uniref:uncharacterized protein LOC134835599 isoform X2 n=1 Tax=Culicoides brevitarsis TaxID=469753 RepID=UPI00307B13D8
MSCSTNLQNEQQHREQIQHLKRKHEEIAREFATTEATSSSLATSSPAKRPKVSGWHVKLALESPTRSDQETDSEDGYSTVHEIETEECRDSDDTESLPESEHTAAYATIDVLEYEIETTSDDNSDNESFCTESSATGSDALYLSTLNNIAIEALYASSSSDDEFIQVDTDDSDGNDPELGRADYWECVKCKNKQNNPLYRFCERCYQVRKSHFPPRPKKLRQRRRSNRGRKPTPTISNSDDATILSDFADSPQKLNKSFKRKQEDSAGDSISSSSESEIEENEAKIQRKRASPKRRCIRSTSSSQKIKQDCASPAKQHLALNSVEVTVTKSTSSSSLESDFSLSKQSTIAGKGMFDRVLSQHDSGISSQEAGSSQESMYSVDLKPAPLQRVNAEMSIKRSYDDTSESSEELFAGNKRFKASVLVATSSNVSESSVVSNASSISGAASLRQTASDSSLLQNGNKEQPRDQQLSRTLSQNLDDDSKICRLCFDNEKSAVFVHTKKACSGCCYTCAMKSWKKWKECPFCKEKARNVIKLYSH